MILDERHHVRVFMSSSGQSCFGTAGLGNFIIFSTNTTLDGMIPSRGTSNDGCTDRCSNACSSLMSMSTLASTSARILGRASVVDLSGLDGSMSRRPLARKHFSHCRPGSHAVTSSRAASSSCFSEKLSCFCNGWRTGGDGKHIGIGTIPRRGYVATDALIDFDSSLARSSDVISDIFCDCCVDGAANVFRDD